MSGDPIIEAALHAYDDLLEVFGRVIKTVECFVRESPNGENCVKQVRGMLYSLADGVDSLLTRARQSPQLVATWGPERYIVFLVSKASDLASTRYKLFYNLIIKYNTCGSDYGGAKKEMVPSTELGYGLYSRALSIAVHHVLEGEGGPPGHENVVSYLIDVVRYRRLSPGVFLQLVETLSRLITAGFSEYSMQLHSLKEILKSVMNCDDAKKTSLYILEKIKNTK